MAQQLERAIALRKAGDVSGAMRLFDQLLKADPLDADLLYQYGKALNDGRDYAGAAKVFETHLLLRPNHTTALSRLAFARFRAGDLEGAEDAYQHLLARKGPYAPAIAPIAQMRYLQGREDEGAALMEAALRAPTSDPESRLVQALILLQRGRYGEGFEAFEARWEAEQFDHPEWVGDPERHWRHGPAGNRPLVVQSEEGFGDIIMMSRFVRRLAQTRETVWFRVPEPLRRLMSSLDPRVQVVSSGTDVPAEAVNVGVMSLPYLLGIASPADVPGDPYLSATAPPARGGGGPLRVGLVWAGGEGTVHDRDRSIADVAVLDPLLAVPGVEWHSLQVGSRADDLAGRVASPGPLADFAETANLVATLDLTITVDTAVCHLAGAMGLPVWIMVPTVPEWRWMCERDRSPWYPSARLFRRTQSSAWGPCIEEIRTALLGLARA